MGHYCELRLGRDGDVGVREKEKKRFVDGIRAAPTNNTNSFAIDMDFDFGRFAFGRVLNEGELNS